MPRIEQIFNDVYIHLFPYLLHQDIYLLSWCNKSLKLLIIDLLKSYLICKINNKLLQIFGNSFLQFKQLLKESAVVISGSFVLETILDENYDGDIDMYQVGYCERYKFSDLDKYMYTAGNISGSTNMIEDDGWIHCYGPLFNTGSEIIRKITNYTINGKKVQIVHLDDNCSNIENDEKQLINTNTQITRFNKIRQHVADFDFDICKSIYYRDDKGDHLEIDYIDNIFAKNTPFKFKTTGMVSSVGRAKKYSERGFKFNIENFITSNEVNYDAIEVAKLKYWREDKYVPAVSIFILDSQGHIIRGNKNIIEESWGYAYNDNLFFDDNEALGVGEDNNTECHDGCIIKFLDSRLQHSHARGILYDRDIWTDLIIIGEVRGIKGIENEKQQNIL